MRRMIAVMVMLGMSAATAAAVSQDSFEISVTPILSYGISVSTPTGGLAFGTQALDTAVVNADPATVTNSGTVRADWTLQTAALDAWTLGTTLSDSGLNKAVLAARFNGTIPDAGDFVDNDVVLTATEKNCTAANFAGDQNGDDVLKTAERKLWVFLKTPSDTLVDTQQRFRVIVRAYAASRF